MARFLRGQHLVVAGLFDVEDFSLEGQDGLELAIAALLGGASGAFALDQIQFTTVWVALAAVSQFAGQSAAVERAFAAGQVRALRAASRAREASMALLMMRLAMGGFCSRNMPSRSLTKAERSCDVGVELALGLAFELRLRELDADHGNQALAHIVAAEVLLHVFEESELLTDGVIVRVRDVRKPERCDPPSTC